MLELHWAVCSSVTGICKVYAQLSKCRQSIYESNDISEETGGQGASKGWVETLVSKKLQTTRALDVLITSMPRLKRASRPLPLRATNVPFMVMSLSTGSTPQHASTGCCLATDLPSLLCHRQRSPLHCI